MIMKHQDRPFSRQRSSQRYGERGPVYRNQTRSREQGDFQGDHWDDFAGREQSPYGYGSAYPNYQRDQYSQSSYGDQSLGQGPRYQDYGLSDRIGEEGRNYPGQRSRFGRRGQPSMNSDYRGRGPKSFSRSDERLKEEICERLTDHPDIDASEIDVEVNQGVVTLSGNVDSRWMKYLSEELVEEVHGIKDVKNEIRIVRAGLEEVQDFESGSRNSQKSA
jgi:osmotically-inducible protein OsmY